MRLIDADALSKQIKDSIAEYGNTYSNDLLNGLGMVLQMLDNAPTVKPCENCDLYFKAMTKEEMKKGGAE